MLFPNKLFDLCKQSCLRREREVLVSRCDAFGLEGTVLQDGLDR